MVPAGSFSGDALANGKEELVLRRLRSVAIGAILVTGPQSIQAQSSPSRPAPDERVRIHLADGSGTVDGRVIGWIADTLVLGGAVFNGRLPDTSMRVPRSGIVSYRQSLGRDYDRGFARGLRTGALVGGGIGLAFVVAGALMDNTCEDICIPPVAIGAVLGVGAALGGVLLGATFGTIAAPDRWGEPQSVASSDGRRPARGRLALKFSLARH